MRYSTALLHKQTEYILPLLNDPKTLSESKEFQDFLATFTAMEEAVAAARKSIKEGFDAHNVKKLDKIPGFKGFIGYVPYTTLMSDGSTPPRYFKKQLDTRKVNGYRALHGELPKGVTAKISERFKVDVEAES
jgi:hypothetical protein